MSGTIIGKVQDLTIGCVNGDKHLYGRVLVEGSLLYEVFGHSHFAPVSGYVSIYGERSEELHSHLIVSGEPQAIVGLYPELRSLFTMRRCESELSFYLMLSASDFNYFSSFIEAHFFRGLIYQFNILFLGFPVDAQAQAKLAFRGPILPTTARPDHSGSYPECLK
jgi:hypothetical protein